MIQRSENKRKWTRRGDLDSFFRLPKKCPLEEGSNSYKNPHKIWLTNPSP